MRKYMSKRQRPCDFCRSRKSACRIDHSPPCRACVLSRRECTFLHDAPPRKRPEGQDATTGSGVAVGGRSVMTQSPEDEEEEHEDNNGLNADSSGGDDGGRDVYASLFSNQLHHGHDDGVVQQMHLYDDSEGLASALQMDLDVSAYQFMSAMSPFGSQEAQVSSAGHERFTANGGGSPLQTVDQVGDGGCSQIMGLTGDMDPFLIDRYRSDEVGFVHFKQLSIQSVQSHPYPVQFLTSKRALVARTREATAETEVPDARLRADLEAVVSPSIGQRLLSLFDTYIAPQFPIFSTESPPDPGSSPVHLLAAVYAIAFPFRMYDDRLCIELIYETPPYQDLSRLVNLSLRPDMHSPDIVVAQTLILLLIRPLANPLVTEAPYKGSLLGSLAAVAATLGLHLDAGSWNIAPSQVALRRRLSFTIYSLDKWIAASLGRPRQLREDDWLVTSLEMNDRIGTNLTDAEWDYLVFTSRITGILDCSLSRLFSLRASQQMARDPRYALPIVENLLQELSGIYGAMPHGNSALAPVQLLSYHYVRLLVLRAVARPPPVQSFGGQPHVDSGAVDQKKVTEMLRATASDFVSFIRGIKTDATQVFWPPWGSTIVSALCFTLLSAVVTSRTEGEAREWLEMLQSTRRELRLKAATLPVLRLGLLRMDAVFWRGLENLLSLEPHVLSAVQSVLSM